MKILLILLLLCSTAYATPTPQGIIDDAFVELKKVTSLDGKKFLDFGCGDDLRVSKNALNEGMIVTAIEIDSDASDLAQAEIDKENLDLEFLPDTDGLKIDWKDFDVVLFSYEIESQNIIISEYETILPNGEKHIVQEKGYFDVEFMIKAQELKDTSYVVLLFSPPDFRRLSHSLGTDPYVVADGLHMLELVGHAKKLTDGDIDMYMQIYKK